MLRRPPGHPAWPSGHTMRGPSLARCRGLGCGLHVFPTQRGAHSSSGLQARSWTLGKPSLPLPVPTASGPRRTPSLQAPPLGGLDACRPVRPAASLTGVSTVVSRGRAVCCSAGGGHLRGEGEPWAPRPPPPWHLLCVPPGGLRSGATVGVCESDPLGAPVRPLSWAYAASQVPTGLPEGWAAWERGASDAPRGQLLMVAALTPSPGQAPALCPVAGTSWWEMAAWSWGAGNTSRPSWTGVQRVDVCPGPAGQLWGFQSPRTATWSGRVPAARRLWGCPSLPSPCPGRSDGAPGPCDSPPVSSLQLPLRSVREASWLTTQV